jgi:hypothetical protein
MVKRTKPAEHRFRIQKRVEVKARDLSNKPFLFSELWRTVAETDAINPAERKLNEERRAHRRSKFRLVEAVAGQEHVIHNWQ